MRILFLTLLSLLTCHTLFAQPWLELLPNKPRQELTFYDYQKAFETYWAPFNVVDGYYIENGEKVKATGWKQYKRWEYMMQLKADPVTGAFPKQSALEIKQSYEAKFPPARSEMGNWRSVGPFTPDSLSSGLGRINCIAFHPADTNTFWVGSPSGGLWITIDNGNSWQCLTDQNESPGVSDIIISENYKEDGTIYIATGDRDWFDSESIGVLVSHDYGHTWQKTGLSFNIGENKEVYRIIRHPYIPNTMLAATNAGVFRTVTGGITWNALVTENTFIDLEYHPTDPQIIYGSTFQGQVFTTTNGGSTWEETLLRPFPGRIEMAVSPDRPDWLYAVAAEYSSLGGVYLSKDHGQSFQLVLDGSTLNLLGRQPNGSDSGGQAYYDLAITVSPHDANLVFIGGINTWKSTDSGLHWEYSSKLNPASYASTHVDKHALAFRADGVLFEGNDGGIYTSHDHGQSWKDITRNMAISQMYKLGVSATEKETFLAGLQDNGPKMHTAEGWMDVLNSDGMECIIDPTNANNQYASIQEGSLARTFDRWKSGSSITPVGAGEGIWVTPYVMDPTDAKTIYAGYDEIWKTINRGDTWEKVSTLDLPGKYGLLAIAPSDPNVVYATGSNYLCKTMSGGKPFVQVPMQFPTSNYIFSYLAVKQDDPNTLWVTSSSYTGPGIYESVDGGITWTDISNGIPPFPVYCVIQNKQVTDRVDLYAGTELGVYYKRGNADWVPFNQNLPNVITRELDIYYDADPMESLIRAATYGRGMWESPLNYESGTMQVVSSAITHPTVAPVKPGHPSQEILKLEIIASGDMNPLTIRSFTFSTSGSTDPSTDIAAARVYYSGHIPQLTTTNLFGNQFDKPNGTFEIEGEQPLSAGYNYFWLVYDLPVTATEDHVLDAEYHALQIDTQIISNHIAPDSNRTIEFIYCDAGATEVSFLRISRVTMGEIDQTSVQGPYGFQDFTHLIHEVSNSEPIYVSVQTTQQDYRNELLIWIDYNRDGDFEDPDELVYDSESSLTFQYHAQILPVPDHYIGLTRMRIRLHNKDEGPVAYPCNFSNTGEVEDYSILFQEMVSTEEDKVLQPTLLVFPNPFSNTLKCIMDTKGNVVPLYVTDLTGRVLYHDQFNTETEIELNDLAEGIYFLFCGGHQMVVVKTHSN